MKAISYLYRSLFFTGRLYAAIGLDCLIFVLSFLFPALYSIGVIVFWILLGLLLLEALVLLVNGEGVVARRKTQRRLSNGDPNDIVIQLANHFHFRIWCQVIDEIPEQFQYRDFKLRTSLAAGEQRSFRYTLRPVSRGEYHFGAIRLFVKTFIGFVERRITMDAPHMMPCYPSFQKLRQYELLAISNRLTEVGVKKIRRIGHSTEFDQIKEYVPGDDVRTINWKATARQRTLMVNHYRDERAQQVYCLVDMGRIMKMPFDGLSLLDYAINASLVIGHVAFVKQDKPGVLGFSNKMNFMVKAERKGDQLLRLQEALYNAKTDYLETDYETVFTQVRTKIPQRSLLLLFSNFETLSGLRRQMKYLRRMASQHLLVVVFFENTELKELLAAPGKSTEEIYQQAIAQKFELEKQQIVRELQQYGIQSIYTPPQKLTINAINKYLELKNRGLI